MRFGHTPLSEADNEDPYSFGFFTSTRSSNFPLALFSVFLLCHNSSFCSSALQSRTGPGNQQENASSQHTKTRESADHNQLNTLARSSLVSQQPHMKPPHVAMANDGRCLVRTTVCRCKDKYRCDFDRDNHGAEDCQGGIPSKNFQSNSQLATKRHDLRGRSAMIIMSVHGQMRRTEQVLHIRARP